MEVVDTSGNISTDFDTVISRWKNDYEVLFSNSDDPNFDEAHLQNIKHSLMNNTIPTLQTDVSRLNEPISRLEVERSIYRAKLRRAAGFDGIPAEVLRNPVCIDLLYKIINFSFESGTVPSEWNTGIIRPIPKSDSKDPRNPLNYRGICLISIPSKVYADVLNTRFIEWIEQNNIVVDEQNGFRRNRSCLEHIYTLYSVINKRKQQRKSTYVCFVDAKKAFDTVQRDCLWYKLMSLGINGKILKAVQSLYENVNCVVKINDHSTPFIDVHQGVKEGCKLSPTLFSLYVNDLAQEIKSLNTGVDIDEVQLSILLYADDVALIAPDANSLQIMLNKLNEWCCKWRLAINSDKTKIIHFRPVNAQKCNDTFSCGNIDIEMTDRYKYLGLWFQENLDMKFATTELAKSASRALSVVYAKFKSVGGMAYEVYTKLYKSLVEPILYYCAGIWGLTDYSKINTVQNKACRYFLGVGKNAANSATRGDMGWTDCFVKQRLECCRLYSKLTNIVDSRLVKSVFTWSRSHGRCWEKRFLKFARDSGFLNLFQNDHICVKSTIKQCKAKLTEIDQEKWHSNLFNDTGQENGNKLRTYRLYKTILECEEYIKLPLNRDHRRILAMFRCGNLPLHIETGRYARPKIPADQRSCFYCSEKVENEIHFLIECPFYDDIKRKLFQKANLCNSNFNGFSQKDKFIFLMNNVNMQPLLASTLYDMWQRRKRVLN
ncbi:MAG: reverse transcriptase family protein [Candidatus Thiodiazotropha taylori]|nr:reverse transcriptase family protein [Candidatus Thiodiazotropha taylori]MCW4285899.1 reverse transcriptase family protein [Candidatus Thiodiazotropha taylori]